MKDGPERIEYGSSDAYNDEDEFYKKYCMGCSSLVCGGVRDTIAKEGCKHYRREMKEETHNDYQVAGPRAYGVGLRSRVTS